jgi:hypothetical protein
VVVCQGFQQVLVITGYFHATPAVRQGFQRVLTIKSNSKLVRHKGSNESSPSSLFPTLRPVKNFIESSPSGQFIKGSTKSSLPSTSFHFNSIATIILAIILCIKIYQLLRQQTYFKSIHSINCSPSSFLQVWFMTATDFVIRAAEIRRTHPTRPRPEPDSVCYTSRQRAIGCIVLLTLSHTANALSSPRQMTKKPVTASTPRRL